MEDFFDAVDRAFTKEKYGIPVPSRLELESPLELPLSVVASPRETRSPQRRRVADRRHRTRTPFATVIAFCGVNLIRSIIGPRDNT
jgi:hypothetical protein